MYVCMYVCTRIGHMTERKRRQNLAKLQRLFPKLNESMKLLRSEGSGTSFGENIFYLLALKCSMCLIFLETLL